MLEPPTVFFGYPRRPQAQRDAITGAIQLMSATGQVKATSWEHLAVGGRLIIDRITEAISSSALSAFDVTTLNHNVMFELGFAIGREKRVWLVRDDSVVRGGEQWDQVGLLSTVGYHPFRNGGDIAGAFFAERPDEQRGSLYDDLIRPSLLAATSPTVFYIPDIHNTEANRLVSRRIQQERQRRLHVAIADPTESSAEPLSWYAREIYQAIAVVVHFSSPGRHLADIHNARASLIAGLAHGMGRDLLMLADRDFLAPIDYRDLMFRYPHARAAHNRVDGWLTSKLTEAHRQLAFDAIRGVPARSARDLRGLRLGEHVAENEEDSLGEYFVNTRDFDQIMAGRASVFVGRKGAGKTANLFQAAARLSSDPRNLVVVVKPVGYEWDSLLKLLKRYVESDSREFLLLALWNFLLESEIAAAAASEARARPAGPVFGTPEWDLITFVEGPGKAISEDFAVRLERAVADLDAVPQKDTIGETRRALAESLESGITRALRGILGRVLAPRSRVAILVDNLDKPWESGADLPLLSRFLLALPPAAARLTTQFQKAAAGREPVQMTVAVFLRADVFAHITETAREPDKIPFTRLVWSTPEMLLRVLEERYMAARGGDAVGSELWDKYFCAHVENVPTSQYITFRVLPRPRDIVFLCNSAITVAVNSGHHTVEVADIREAEKQYSRFAFEALLVEAEASGLPIEPIIFEFIGGSPILTESELTEAIKRGAPDADLALAANRLRDLSFIGLETADGVFDYSDDPGERRIAERLAVRRLESGERRRYRIHPAFRPHLGISDRIVGGVFT